MATVIHQIRKQSYDHNPRGSATAHVTMRQDNPFDRRVVSAIRDLRGLDLGDATQTDPGAVAAPASGGFWSNMGSGILSTLTSVGAKVIPALAVTAVQAAGDSGAIPGVAPVQAPAPVAPPKPAMPAWVIPAGVAAAGIVLFLAMRKKK
jgi:hypothetical protein